MTETMSVRLYAVSSALLVKKGISHVQYPAKN
jgi:hypothetical protein